jgi:folate-dependent phosphoribosylglycinamide formyltransferase PurN
VRILFAGTPDVVIPSLNWIVSSEHELLGILTRPAAAQGRSSALIDSPAAEFAKNNSINLYTSIDEITSEDLLSSVDLVIVIAYGKIIPNDLLGIPKHGWINVHFSLLPKSKDIFYYNTNIWKYRLEDGFSVKVDDCKQLSGLVVYREIAIKHFKKRIELMESKYNELINKLNDDSWIVNKELQEQS